MKNILKAYGRASRSLLRPDIFWHMLWPGVLSFILWGVLIYFFWSDLTTLLLHFVQSWPWIGAWLAARTAVEVFIHLLLVLLLIPLVFFTSSLLISTLALPFMLDRVSATSYSDLTQYRAGTMTGSIINSLTSALLFIVLAAITLPLWLIPGMGLILSIALSAWMNQRNYRYDALMNHADAEEFKALPIKHSASLYLLGIFSALMLFIPIFNLFVPAITGLVFVHYLLEMLRIERAKKAPELTLAKNGEKEEGEMTEATQMNMAKESE